MKIVVSSNDGSILKQVKSHIFATQGTGGLQRKKTSCKSEVVHGNCPAVQEVIWLLWDFYMVLDVSKGHLLSTEYALQFYSLLCNKEL